MVSLEILSGVFCMKEFNEYKEYFGGFSGMHPIDQALVNYYETQVEKRLKSRKPAEELLYLGVTLYLMIPEYEKLGHSIKILSDISEKIQMDGVRIIREELREKSPNTFRGPREISHN
jgi:hypothetical protein